MASEDRGAIADRYALALLELAEESAALDPIAADLRALRAMIAESADLRRLLVNPVIDRGLQERAIAALAARAQFGLLVVKFLGLMARKRRLFALEGAIGAFFARLAAKRGEAVARVASARPLSESQLQAVASALHRALGRGTSVEAVVDSSLLGGLVVQVGSRMIDGSLKTKLQRLSLAMKGVG